MPIGNFMWYQLQPSSLSCLLLAEAFSHIQTPMPYSCRRTCPLASLFQRQKNSIYPSDHKPKSLVLKAKWVFDLHTAPWVHIERVECWSSANEDLISFRSSPLISFSFLPVLYNIAYTMSSENPDFVPAIDPSYLRVYTPVFYATTSLSLVTNTLVMLIHSCMVYHRVAEFNRVSLRLTVAACIYGVIRASVRLAMTVPAYSVTCLVDSFFLGWMEIASPMCLAFVGIHAVVVLVLNANHPRKFEKYYHIIIFFYSLVASIITVSYRTHNYPGQFRCW